MAFRNLRFELVRAPMGSRAPSAGRVHFTYPYPDMDYMNDYAWLHVRGNVIILVTAGAPTLLGHCSHHVPQAVVMRQHTMPLFWRMLHRAATSCTRQAARSKRSKRSEPSACPIPPCIPPARAATALPIIPSAWSGPVHLSHTATRSRRSQASASQYPVSCRLPADSCFRLVLHAERSP